MAIYLITGASSGIGAAMSERLCKDGRTVYGIARRKEKLDEIEAKHPGRFVPMVCDVSDEQAVRNLCENLPELPDVAILNAGVGKPDSPETFDMSIFEAAMAVNVFGVMYFIDALFPKFAERGRGAFVATASLAAYRGLPRGASYASSKAAVSVAMESLRLTYAEKTGVDFIVAHPGFVETPMTEGIDFPMPFLWSADKAAKYILEGIEKGKPTINFPAPMRLLISLAWMLPPKLYQKMVRY